MSEFVGDAHYGSLQAKLNKRYGYGLSFLISYTLSHSIDDLNTRTSAYDSRLREVRHRLRCGTGS